MKKLLSLLLALALIMSCAAVLAEDYYPAEKVSYNVWIRMRPMNGDADQMEIFKIMEETAGGVLAASFRAVGGACGRPSADRAESRQCRIGDGTRDGGTGNECGGRAAEGDQ